VTHLFLYFLAIFCLSQSAAFAKWAACPPEVIGFWRLLAAGLIVLPWAYFKSELKTQWKNHPQSRKWVYLTGLFFFAHLWTFFYASQHTLISHTMIIFATNPLFVALGQWWLNREAPPRRTIGAYFLALISLGLLFQQSKMGSGAQFWGDFSALLSAFFCSIYILFSKKSRDVFHNSVFTSVMYMSTALCFAVLLLFSNNSWVDYPPHTWLAILGQVVFSTLLGHSLIAYLMRFMNVTLMSTGKLAEPVMASIVASFVFQETINTYVGFAFVLTALSLFLLFWPFKKSKAPETEPL
jgi:drug/metabolite transporter (DMT)-like permease